MLGSYQQGTCAVVDKGIQGKLLVSITGCPEGMCSELIVTGSWPRVVDSKIAGRVLLTLPGCLMLPNSTGGVAHRSKLRS